MNNTDRIAMLELDVAELRRELAELRHQLATEVRTRRIVVADPDEDEDRRHEVSITPADVTVWETYDGAEVTATLCADNGIASVMVRGDDEEPGAEMQTFNRACGFGHDPQSRPAALVSVGDIELVSYVPGIDYTTVDVHDLAGPST